MKVLITGAQGFLGKNLQLNLKERRNLQVICFSRGDSLDELPGLMLGVDFVFHLAGINRPLNPAEFVFGNLGLTRKVCEAVTAEAKRANKTIPILYSSSIQAGGGSEYGQSKLAAEIVLQLANTFVQTPTYIFRLSNVFGKWCKPNYNSVVATFCHNVANDVPIQINNSTATVNLVYVDDVIERFLSVMDETDLNVGPDGFVEIAPQYKATVGELALYIRTFRDSRETLVTASVGAGLARALYSTYLSYLPVESFTYKLPQYADKRGVFVEMLKTPDYGQFSFFTAHPGITRGGHYHHSKTEKFLVIKGAARFKFRHMQTGQTHELTTTGASSVVVETIPGWTHDITNIGSEEMIVMLWANEVFDRNRPDTFACPL